MYKKDTGQNLLRYKFKDFKFVVFDYETENLNLCCLNKPWELGYIVVEGGNITKKVNDRILWKDINISEDAKRITKFNLEDYKKTAKDPQEVLNGFEKYLLDPNFIVIHYNGFNFDNYIHQLFREKLGKSPNYSFLYRSIDVLSLCRAFRLGKHPPETREDFFFWQHQLSAFYSNARLRFLRKKQMNGSTTLSSMAKELNVSVAGDAWHNGLYDVEVTWEILKALLWKQEISVKHIT
jgi:DNA polymerase III alpha subunit (gram-positive type)